MRILCIGDSNTYGYDPRSYIGSRYPAEVRWTDRLDDHIVINCGVNGMTVLRARSMFAERIRRTEADLAIVMLGTNDLLTGADAGQITEWMEALLDCIAASGKPILLIAPPLLENGDWVPGGEEIEESRMLGEMYRELAEMKDCFFADAGEWDIETAFDGVHFSPAGHEVFALKLKEVLDLISTGEQENESLF